MAQKLNLYHVQRSSRHGYIYKCGSQDLAEDYLVLAHTPRQAQQLVRGKLGLTRSAARKLKITEHQLPTAPAVLASACEGAQYYSEERRFDSQTYECTVHTPLGEAETARSKAYQAKQRESYLRWCAEEGIDPADLDDPC